MQQAYDLFLFIGQSNMAGRGVSSPRWPEGAPELTPGAGFEYRSVSAPEQLFPIQEPFGAAENDPNGIFEPGMKTGSLVTAFVNAYYAQTHTPIIGVSASKGGSGDLCLGRDKTITCRMRLPGCSGRSAICSSTVCPCGTALPCGAKARPTATWAPPPSIPAENGADAGKAAPCRRGDLLFDHHRGV